MTSDLRHLLRDLRRQGWRIEHSRHLRLYPPGSRPPIACSRTPSDKRAMDNLLASLHHAWEEEGPRP